MSDEDSAQKVRKKLFYCIMVLYMIVLIFMSMEL